MGGHSCPPFRQRAARHPPREVKQPVRHSETDSCGFGIWRRIENNNGGQECPPSFDEDLGSLEGLQRVIVDATEPNIHFNKPLILAIYEGNLLTLDGNFINYKENLYIYRLSRFTSITLTPLNNDQKNQQD